MTTAAIIVAAGRGTRAGGPVPKQFQMLAGHKVVALTVAAFAVHPEIDEVVVVLHPDDRKNAVSGIEEGGKIRFADGKDNRNGSVRTGLAAVSDGIDNVLIHDGARPLVSPDLISRVIAAVENGSAAAPALPVTDALWTGRDGRVTGTRDRDGLFRAQTPQGFRLANIRAAHDSWPADRLAADDVEVALAHGIDVTIVEGEEDNLKITYPGDFARAEAILGRQAGN